MGKIMIPQWLREARPMTAGFCDMINEALEKRPNLSLAEFAEQLDAVNKENTLKLIQAAERRQFGGDEV